MNEIKLMGEITMPPKHTVAYHLTRRETDTLKKQNWPELATPKITEPQTSGDCTNAGQVDKNSVKEEFCKSYAEALKIKKTSKPRKCRPGRSARAPGRHKMTQTN